MEWSEIWSKMAPRELAEALRTIPKQIGYAWCKKPNGDWERRDCEEYGVASAGYIQQLEDGRFRCQLYRSGEVEPSDDLIFDDIAEARRVYDAYLLEKGWILDDSTIGPPFEKPELGGLEVPARNDEADNRGRNFRKVLRDNAVIEQELDRSAPVTRACTTCGLQGKGVRQATHIATAPSKMQWYECGGHEDFEHAEALGERDNLNSIRCSLVPLSVWLKLCGIEA